jgi:hypothetical protein
VARAARQSLLAVRCSLLPVRDYQLATAGLPTDDGD